MRAKRWAGAMVIVLGAALPGAARAAAPVPGESAGEFASGTFRSPTAVVIFDGTMGAPYPSTVEVSGLAGVLTGILVGFADFEHVSPRDTDALLVSPSGASAIVLSDACGLVDMINVNLVFDDGAAGPLPASGPCLAGGYQPTDWTSTPPDTFPPPAPAGPWGTTFAGFLGAPPNGTWSLYVFDDVAAGDPAGRIEWWTLTLTTDAGPLFLDGFETGNTARWSSQAP